MEDKEDIYTIIKKKRMQKKSALQIEDNDSNSNQFIQLGNNINEEKKFSQTPLSSNSFSSDFPAYSERIGNYQKQQTREKYFCIKEICNQRITKEDENFINDNSQSDLNFIDQDSYSQIEYFEDMKSQLCTKKAKTRLKQDSQKTKQKSVNEQKDHGRLFHRIQLSDDFNKLQKYKAYFKQTQFYEIEEACNIINIFSVDDLRQMKSSFIEIEADKPTYLNIAMKKQQFYLMDNEDTKDIFEKLFQLTKRFNYIIEIQITNLPQIGSFQDNYYMNKILQQIMYPQKLEKIKIQFQQPNYTSNYDLFKNFFYTISMLLDNVHKFRFLKQLCISFNLLQTLEEDIISVFLFGKHITCQTQLEKILKQDSILGCFNSLSKMSYNLEMISVKINRQNFIRKNFGMQGLADILQKQECLLNLKLKFRNCELDIDNIRQISQIIKKQKYLISAEIELTNNLEHKQKSIKKIYKALILKQTILKAKFDFQKVFIPFELAYEYFENLLEKSIFLKKKLILYCFTLEKSRIFDNHAKIKLNQILELLLYV